MKGIIDCDLLSRSPTQFIPNLEAMKLFFYFNRNVAKTKLIFDENYLDVCDEIWIRKEYRDSPTPRNLLKGQKNVNWGGQAFTDDLYVPFENLNIERAHPNFKVYNEYILEHMLTKKSWQNRFLRYIDFSFIRLFAGVEPPFYEILEGSPLLVYDSELFEHKDYHTVYQEMLNRKPNLIEFSHPTRITKPDQIESLIEIRERAGIEKKNFRQRMYIDLSLTENDFEYLMSQYIDSFKSYPRFSIALPCLNQDNRAFSSKEKAAQEFERIFNIIYTARSQGIYLDLIYIQNLTNPYDDAFKHFCAYVRTPYAWDKNLKEFAIRTKTEGRTDTLFNFYYDEPRLQYLFYCSLKEAEQGGSWNDKRRYKGYQTGLRYSVT